MMDMMTIVVIMCMDNKLGKYPLGTSHAMLLINNSSSSSNSKRTFTYNNKC